MGLKRKMQNENLEQIYIFLANKYKCINCNGQIVKKEVREKIIEECRKKFNIQVTHREIKKMHQFGKKKVCFSYATVLILLSISDLIKEGANDEEDIRRLKQYIKEKKSKDYIEDMLTEAMWDFIVKEKDNLSRAGKRGDAFDIFWETKCQYDEKVKMEMGDLVKKKEKIYSYTMLTTALAKKIKDYSRKCNRNQNRMKERVDRSNNPKYIYGEL